MAGTHLEPCMFQDVFQHDMGAWPVKQQQLAVIIWRSSSKQSARLGFVSGAGGSRDDAECLCCPISEFVEYA